MRRLFLILCTFVLLLSGCASPAEGRRTTYRSELSDTGLFGEHPVGEVVESIQLSGEFSGAHFILVGGVDGKVSTSTVLSFSWSPQAGEYLPTDLPRNKFRVVVDEEKESPTIEFLFNEDWLKSVPPNPNDPFDFDYHLSENDRMNLNKYIQSDSLELVLVRISSEDLKSEPFLPH